MADTLVQINRIEAPIDQIRTSGHSGLMAYASDLGYLVYQEGPSKIEHLIPDSGKVINLISGNQYWSYQDSGIYHSGIARVTEMIFV